MSLWNLIQQHPGIACIAAYWIFSAMVGGMPLPQGTTGFYLWLYNFLHILAGNLTAAVATKFPDLPNLPPGSAAQQTTRTTVVTGAASGTGNGSSKIVPMLVLLLVGAAMLSGCSSWERTTFQALSASKAVLDEAQVDYEAGTIPKTQAAFQSITAAKAAQATAVQAMVTYEQLKITLASAPTLQAQEQVVAQALAAIAPLIADVRALIAAVKGTGVTVQPPPKPIGPMKPAGWMNGARLIQARA